MPDVYMLTTFWEVIGATLIVLFIMIPLTMMWMFALMDLFSRRDIRWLKVSWLLAIVLLPFFGPLIYLIVRPETEANA